MILILLLLLIVSSTNAQYEGICNYPSGNIQLITDHHYYLKSYCDVYVKDISVGETLPPGLSIESNGDIYGIPITEGSYTVKITSKFVNLDLKIIITSPKEKLSGYFASFSAESKFPTSQLNNSNWNSFEQGTIEFESTIEKTSKIECSDCTFLNEFTKSFTRTVNFQLKGTGYIYFPSTGEWHIKGSARESIYFYFQDMNQDNYKGKTIVYNTAFDVTLNIGVPGFYPFGFLALHDEGSFALHILWTSTDNSIVGEEHKLYEDDPLIIVGDYIPPENIFLYVIPDLKYQSSMVSCRIGQKCIINPINTVNHGGSENKFSKSCPSASVTFKKGIITINSNKKEEISCIFTLTNPMGVSTANMLIYIEEHYRLPGLKTRVYKPSNISCNEYELDEEEISFISDNINEEKNVIPFKNFDFSLNSDIVIEFDGIIVGNNEIYDIFISTHGSFYLTIGNLTIGNTGCGYSEKSLNIFLPSTGVIINLVYFTSSTTEKSLLLEWESENIDREVIPKAAFYFGNEIQYKFTKTKYFIGKEIVKNPLVAIESASDFEIFPELPGDLIMNENGEISGTPNKLSEFSEYIITFKINNNAFHTKIKFSIEKSPSLPPFISYNNIKSSFSRTYSSPLLSTNEMEGIYSIVGKTPPGLNINPKTGEIYGNSIIGVISKVIVRFSNDKGGVETDVEVRIDDCKVGEMATLELYVNDIGVKYTISTMGYVANSARIEKGEQLYKVRFCTSDTTNVRIESTAKFGGWYRVNLVNNKIFHYAIIPDNNYNISFNVITPINVYPELSYLSSQAEVIEGEFLSLSPFVNNGAKYFSLTTNSLVTGLEFDSKTGRIFGFPQYIGQTVMYIEAFNEFGAGNTFVLTITVHPCKQALIKGLIDFPRNGTSYSILLVSDTEEKPILKMSKFPTIFLRRFGICTSFGQYTLKLDTSTGTTWGTSDSITVILFSEIRYSISKPNQKEFTFGYSYFDIETSEVQQSTRSSNNWATDPNLNWKNYTIKNLPRRIISSQSSYIRYSFDFKGKISGVKNIKFLFSVGTSSITYFNGHEVYRRGLEAGQSSSALGPEFPETIKTVYFTADLLREGKNYIGMDLRKSSAFSTVETFKLYEIRVFGRDSDCVSTNVFDEPMLLNSNKGYEYYREAIDGSITTDNVVNNLNLKESCTEKSSYLRYETAPDSYLEKYQENYMRECGEISSSNVYSIEYSYPDHSAHPLNYLRIQTGPQFSSRDPQSWLIKGSYRNNSGTQWEEIFSTSDGDLPETRKSWKSYPVHLLYMSYDYIKFDYSSTKNWGADNGRALEICRVQLQTCSMQMCKSFQEFPEAFPSESVTVPCGYGYIGQMTATCEIIENEAQWIPNSEISTCTRVPTKIGYSEIIFYKGYENNYVPMTEPLFASTGFSTDCEFPKGVYFREETGEIIGKMNEKYFEEMDFSCNVNMTTEVLNFTETIHFKSIIPMCPAVDGYDETEVGHEAFQFCSSYENGTKSRVCNYNRHPEWGVDEENCELLPPIIEYPKRVEISYETYLVPVIPYKKYKTTEYSITPEITEENLKFDKNSGIFSGFFESKDEESSEFVFKVTAKNEHHTSNEITITFKVHYEGGSGSLRFPNDNNLYFKSGVLMTYYPLMEGRYDNFTVDLPDGLNVDFKTGAITSTLKYGEIPPPEIGYSFYGNFEDKTDMAYIMIFVEENACEASENYKKTKYETIGEKECEGEYTGTIRRYCSGGVNPVWMDTEIQNCRLKYPWSLSYPNPLTFYSKLEIEKSYPAIEGRGKDGSRFKISDSTLSDIFNTNDGSFYGVYMKGYNKNVTITASEERDISFEVNLIIIMQYCTSTDFVDETQPLGENVVLNCPNGGIIEGIRAYCPLEMEPEWEVTYYRCQPKKLIYSSNSYSFHHYFIDFSDTPEVDIIPSSFALTPKIMGLTIDQETGAISGNVTDEVGNYDVEVEMCAEDLLLQKLYLEQLCQNDIYSDAIPGDFGYRACEIDGQTGIIKKYCTYEKAPIFEGDEISTCRYKYPWTFLYETREIKIYFNVELSMDPIVSGFTDLLRFRIARNVTLPEGILLDEKTGRLYGISQLPIDEYEITIIATEEIEREFTMTISVTRNYCYENNYFVETLSGDSTSTSCPNGEGSLIGTCSLGENPKWEIFMNTCPPTLPPENITYSETYYSFYRYQKSSIPPPECGGNIFNYTSFESDVFLPKGLILSKNGGIEGIPVDRKGNYTLHIRMVNIDTYSEYTELTINLYDRECEGDDYLDNIISGESVSETCKGTTDELIIAECSIDEEAVMIYSLDNCSRSFSYDSDTLDFFIGHSTSYSIKPNYDNKNISFRGFPKGFVLEENGDITGFNSPNFKPGTYFATVRMRTPEFNQLISIELNIIQPQCKGEIKDNNTYPTINENEIFYIPCQEGYYGNISRQCGSGIEPIWYEPNYNCLYGVFCELENEWPLTLGNTIGYSLCNNNVIGVMKRNCLISGKWDTAIDDSNCKDKAYELTQNLAKLTFILKFVGSSSVITNEIYISLILVFSRRLGVDTSYIKFPKNSLLRDYVETIEIYSHPSRLDYIRARLLTYQNLQILLDLDTPVLNDGEFTITDIVYSFFEETTEIPTTASESNTGSSNAGVVVGVVFAVLIVVVIVGMVFYVYQRKKVEHRTLTRRNRLKKSYNRMEGRRSQGINEYYNKSHSVKRSIHENKNYLSELRLGPKIK